MEQVSKKASTDSAVLLCEEESCTDYMNLAQIWYPYSRMHIFTACSKCPQNIGETDLSSRTSQHLSGKGQVKLLSDQTIWMSKQLYENVKELDL